MKLELSKTRSLRLDEIQPYAENPRRIPAEAVERVAQSITDYGYQQPIVVDADNVIIVGHTRYLALQKLGWQRADVLVADLPEDKAREYRLVDNRTSEMAGWDHASLVTELREFDPGLLEGYFPNVDLELGQVAVKPEVTSKDIETATKKATRVTSADPTAVHTTPVVCPSCFHTFDVRTRSLPGLSQKDLETLANGESL